MHPNIRIGTDGYTPRLENTSVPPLPPARWYPCFASSRLHSRSPTNHVSPLEPSQRVVEDRQDLEANSSGRGRGAGGQQGQARRGHRQRQRREGAEREGRTQGGGEGEGEGEGGRTCALP